MRRRRPGAAACPAASDLVLLADAGLVLLPDLYEIASGLVAAICATKVGKFFECPGRFKIPGVVAGAGRQPAETQRAQFPAQRLLRDREAELVPEPVQQIGNPPTHHPMHRRDRSILDDLAQGRPMMVDQTRLRARRLASQQARRSRVI